MAHLIDWYFIIIFFAGILGIVVAAILFFVNKTDTFSSRLLAGYLVCFSFLAVNYALMTSSFFQSHPHFWRALGWASFSFAPLAYLYTRSVLEQSFRFRRMDLLLFAPAVLHALNLLPFYILPASEKLEIIQNAIRNKKLIPSEPEGLWPEGWSIWLRVLVGIISTTGGLILLKKWRHKILAKSANEKQNVRIFRWLLLFNLTQAIFWLMIITEFILQFTKKPDLNFTIIFTISASILFVCLYLLVQPSILYGMKGWLQEPEVLVSGPEIIVSKGVIIPSNRNTLSQEQGEAYKHALELHFSQNLPFRKNGYTIGDLSHELNIPSHQLSAFINQEYGKNFNELTNEYRVEYLIYNLKNSTDHLQFTLEALGREAGFNSRAAFITAVKKKTGKTPSELFGRRGENSAG
jgi:AraC-like DNA-binding protein